MKEELKKKVNYIYIIFIIIAIIMLFTPNLGKVHIISRYDDYLDKGIIDGFSGEVGIYLISTIIVSINIILCAIVTFISKNTSKLKYIFLIVVAIISLYTKLGYHHYSGGIAGINVEEDINIGRILSLIF